MSAPTAPPMEESEKQGSAASQNPPAAQYPPEQTPTQYPPAQYPPQQQPQAQYPQQQQPPAQYPQQQQPQAQYPPEQYPKAQNPAEPPPPYVPAQYPPAQAQPIPYIQQPNSVLQQPQPMQVTSSHSVVVTQPQVYAYTEPLPSNAPAIILSCCVFWCCWGGLIPGFIAFVFALTGGSAVTAVEAKSKLTTSYIFSGIGFVIGLIIWIIIFAV